LSGENELYVLTGKYRIHGILTLQSGTTLKLRPEGYIILDDHTDREAYPYRLTAKENASHITVEVAHGKTTPVKIPGLLASTLTIRNFVRYMEKEAKVEGLPTLMLKNFKQNRVTLQGEKQIITAAYELLMLQGDIEDLHIDTLV